VLAVNSKRNRHTEIIFKGMSDISLNERSGQRIAIPVAILGEETEMMTLGSNNHRKFDLFLHLCK
jgi:hypothetical protein